MRFIILATQRTGSTLLVSYLKCHENTPCYGELFQGIKTPRLSVPRYIEWKRFYRKNIKRYIDNHLPENGGFKLMYGQLDRYPELRELLIHRNTFIIHLQRKNLLRRYVSLQLAKEFNKWSNKEKPEFRSIKLNPLQTLQALIKTNQQVKSHQTFKETNSYMDIFYEDVSKTPKIVLDKIWNQLGELPVCFSTNLVKQNPYPLKSMLINFHDVKNILAGTPFEWMLYDDT